MSGHRMAIGALVLLPLVLVAAGCGGSSNEEPATSSATARAASAQASCGADRSSPKVLNVENRVAADVVFAFSEIDCFDWTDRTPAAYSPTTLGPGDGTPARRTMVVDPKGATSQIWTTAVSVAGRQGASVRTRMSSAHCSPDAPSTSCAPHWAVYNGTKYVSGGVTPLPNASVGGRPVQLRATGPTLVVEYAR